jgi:pimeloyl-ACP methyl ester carboxylesterase
MADIMTNGVRIHYERTGGSKPPLVLCHGFSGNGRSWGSMIKDLEKDYDLIVLDARGHGFSAAPESGYTYDNLVADVAGVIRGLHLKKPGVMGQSMGAMTVSMLAARHPDLVGYLVMEDPPWTDSPRSPEERATFVANWRVLLEKYKASSLEEMIEQRRRDLGTDVWPEHELVAWAIAKKELSLSIVQILHEELISYRDIVPHITCPTLLITADPARGAIVTPELARRVCALNPRIQIVNITGAGHNIRRAKSDEYMSAVTAFLSQTHDAHD